MMSAATQYVLALGGRSLGIEMFELAGRDLTASDELVNLALLQADDPTKAVRGQLPLIDEPVQRSGDQPQRGSGFFRGQPITICLRHDHHVNTLSRSLSLFCINPRFRSTA